MSKGNKRPKTDKAKKKPKKAKVASNVGMPSGTSY